MQVYEHQEKRKDTRRDDGCLGYVVCVFYLCSMRKGDACTVSSGCSGPAPPTIVLSPLPAAALRGSLQDGQWQWLTSELEAGQPQ